MPVEVATVGQIARAAVKTLHVHNRYSDYGTFQGFCIQVVHNPAHRLDAVQLVTVQRGSKAQGGARFRAIHHQHRGAAVDPLEMLAGGPGQAGRGGGRNFRSEHAQGATLRLYRFGGLLRCGCFWLLGSGGCRFVCRRLLWWCCQLFFTDRLVQFDAFCLWHGGVVCAGCCGLALLGRDFAVYLVGVGSRCGGLLFGAGCGFGFDLCDGFFRPQVGTGNRESQEKR